MIDTLKRLQTRTLEEGDEKMLFPLMKWTSGHEMNLAACSYINRRFFFVDSSILMKTLSLNLRFRGMNKYPKPAKFDKEKFDIVVDLLKKKYFLGPNDIASANKVIEKILQDKNKLLELANDFGLDNKIRKKLGVEQIKLDTSKMQKPKGKSLFDF